jgi:hypothetical protein
VNRSSGEAMVSILTMIKYGDAKCKKCVNEKRVR